MEMCKQLHTSDEIVFWTVQFFVGLLGIFNTNCRLFWTKFSQPWETQTTPYKRAGIVLENCFSKRLQGCHKVFK